MAKFFRSLISGCALLTLSAAPTHANVGEAYGFGSRSAALGGASAAWGFDGYSSYANPAALGLDQEKRLVFSWSLLDMIPHFTAIDGIIVANQYTTEQVNIGNVDNNYRATTGQALGLTYQIFPEGPRLTFGLTAFLPLDQLAYIDTGETFVPEYFMYRARTQRPQLDAGLGASIGRGFYAGLGVHLAFSLTSNASVFLNTNAAKPSTMRFAASMKPRLAPYFGLLWTNQEKNAITGEDTSQPGDAALGLVIRLPVSSSNDMVLKSAARTFGDFATLDFNFKAQSAIYYDPLALELGTSFKYSTFGRFFVQGEIQFWNRFVPPALSIQDPTIENCSDNGSGDCGINISGGKNPSFNYRTIYVQRLGHELAVSPAVTLRAGYFYRPSILSELSTGAGNYLDPPKHSFSAGVGVRFRHFLNFEVPCNLDFHASYQKLVTQQITKTPGDETDQGAGSLKIGAPGYEAGGSVYGGGASLTLAF